MAMIDKNSLKVAAETDYMTQVIADRQANLDATEKMMSDIKEIAGTLQDNTAKQGQELVRTDQNMDTVAANAEEAHEEITLAQKY